MSALDFPNSPSTNDTFVSNGVTWKYDGAKWDLVSGPSGYVTDTAPSPTYTGDLWYDTNSGELLIRYDSHWVAPVVKSSAKVELTRSNAVLDASPSVGTVSSGDIESTALNTGSLSIGTYLVMFSGGVSVAGGTTTTYVRLKQGSTALQTLNPKGVSTRTDFPISLFAVETLVASGTFAVTIQAPSTDFGATILNGARLIAVKIA